MPEVPFAYRSSLRSARSSKTIVPWIPVDQRGRGFMNEYPPAAQGATAGSLIHFDPVRVEFPRTPSYMVFDDIGRRLGHIAYVMTFDEEYSHQKRPAGARVQTVVGIQPAQSARPEGQD